jgi:uncharacterized protein (DUF983 family)
MSGGGDLQAPTAGARLRAIARQRCPRCLIGLAFRGGLTMYYACPNCGLVFGRESGYFIGAMIVSYMLSVPILGALCLLIWLATGWRADLTILVGAVLSLPLVPPLFRYSRVIWMHFDRVVDPNPESERYVTRPHST